MKLRLNCKLKKLQGHDIEDFHHGSWPNYIESLPRHFQVVAKGFVGQHKVSPWENTKLPPRTNPSLSLDKSGVPIPKPHSLIHRAN